MLATKAIATIEWIGCWHARRETVARVEETLRLSQPSLSPRERNRCGRRWLPRMLNVGGRVGEGRVDMSEHRGNTSPCYGVWQSTVSDECSLE